MSATQKPFKAIAAMALNRVIGNADRLPWHLPEDFKWFKARTTGQVVIMGRKTFESIGRPLPNRQTIVLTRSSVQIPGVEIVNNLWDIDPTSPRFLARDLYICGGAQVYSLALPHCSDLFLTRVKREVAGDTFFPPYEHLFGEPSLVRETAEFDILHYRALAAT